MDDHTTPTENGHDDVTEGQVSETGLEAAGRDVGGADAVPDKTTGSHDEATDGPDFERD